MGRYWFFFGLTDPSSNCVLHHTSSADGQLWATAVPVSDQYIVAPYWHFGVETDGTHVHFATDGEELVYRRGALGGDGTIVWGPKRVAVGPTTDRVWVNTTIGLDTQAKPYVFYFPRRPSGGGYNAHFTVSTANDGTWSTAEGFPAAVHSSWMLWTGLPVGMSDGSMLFVYVGGDGNYYSRQYVNSSLGGQTTIGRGAGPGGWDVVGMGDEVHILMDQTHWRFSLGAWQTGGDLSLPGVGPTHGTLLDPATKSLGVLYLYPDSTTLSYRLSTRNPDGTYTWDTTDSICYVGTTNLSFLQSYDIGHDGKMWASFVDDGWLKVVSCGP
jgi:hypothetical protein